MPSNLKHEADVYLWLRERLLEQHESLRDDEQALADTLEGITHLHEAVEFVLQCIAEDEEIEEGIKARQALLEQRLDRIRHRQEVGRSLVLETLRRCGIRDIRHPEFTVFIQKGRQKVNVIDENVLPDAFKVPQPSKPDKKAIKEALSQQQEVPGAELITSPETLVIRRS